MLELETHGDVRIIHLDDGENRFNGDSIAAWHAAVDELEAIDGSLAVVAVGEGKFFSNGLDLDWLTTAADARSFIAEVHRLFGRMLLFPAYTVAALNGHAFAGGAMLAAAFDYRVMRADRGYWCLPEVDIGLPLSAAMTATITTKLPRTTAHDAMVTGRRYTASDALAGGIVHATAEQADVLDRAVEVAAGMAGKDRRVIADHKRQLHGTAAAVCFADVEE